MIGFGVAGNFAGHLEQANEASDFKNIEVKEEIQPKAIFPFYLPNLEDSFLSTYPISDHELKMPETSYDVQIEPEVALICDIHYSGDEVESVTPRLFGAYNDCSIRRPGAKKISEKKNWGEKSKGLSKNLMKVDSFNEGGVLDHFKIASFHLSNGKLHKYGEDSDVLSYSYFHGKLLDWIVEKMNFQQDVGPAENINEYLLKCNKPSECIISIGATRYTEYGEHNFLKVGDTSIVVVYDKREFSYSEIEEKVEKRDYTGENLSFLVQDII